MDDQPPQSTFERSSAIFDRDGLLVEWDPGFEREFATAAGLIRPGALFRDILRYIYLNDPGARSKILAEGNVEETNRRIEKRIAHFGRDAEFEYIDTHDRIIQVRESVTPSGGIYRVARDVTSARRGAEAASRARSRQKVAVSEAQTWLRRDPAGNFTYSPVTDEMKQVMGVPPEFDASDPMSLYSRVETTPEENAHYAQVMEQSIRTFSVLATDFRTHGADGELRWIRSAMSPTIEPDGSILWTGVLRNITREKLAESQVELLRSAVVNSTDAMIIIETDPSCDPQSKILYVNPAFEELSGFAAVDVVDQPTSQFRTHDPDGLLPARIWGALEGGRSKGLEFQVYHRGGSLMWVEGRFAIVEHLDAGAYRWVMFLRDIADRRRTQTELLRAKEAAEGGSRAKSEFLANMSHEIRTPMNGILGMNGLLLDTPLDEDQRKYADSVQESGEALLRIINDILDISKLEAGKIELEVIDFEIEETVESAVTLMASKAHGKGIDLGLYVEPEARATFRGDPMRIRQVLLNLIGNAVKFTEAGGVSVEVAVMGGAGPEGTRRLRFAVKDSGIGMPEEVRSRLFEKFSQADSSITRRYGGTGLGLAISKELVGLMGGEIGVESRPGLGSTFYFEVPLAASSAPLAEREHLPAQLKGVRALAVDDIEMNLEIITRQLKGFGMEVATCKDAFDALAEVERAWHRGKPHDIVFIDQMMPGLSGEKLAARMRAIPDLSETKLVLISSAGPHGRGAETMKVLDAILDKPIRQRDLLSCLARLYAGTAPSPQGSAHPVQPAQAEAAQAASLAASSGAAVRSGTLKILLAEDNKINQKFALALLGKAGHRIEVAENGLQAVDAMRRSDYDVVLMDIQMPELDGVQATRQIRALPGPKGEIPIIALTAHAMSGAREQYLEAGMNDYVSKPIEPAILLGKLAELANKIEATRQSQEPSATAVSAASVAVAVPSAPATAPTLDAARLDSLAQIMTPEDIKEFLQLYLSQADQRVSRIRELSSGGELGAVAREAHTLVGTAGNVGAKRVSELARSVEEACKAGDGATAGQFVDELHEAAIITSTELRNWLNLSASGISEGA